MGIKQLNRVTVVIADTKNYAQALLSLKKTLSQIKPFRTIFFTDIELPKQEGIEVIKIKPIRSKAEYSEWIIRELCKHISTEFVLIQQWDSWVLDGECWTDEFMDYDYVGAAWLETDGFAVGNGGFSLRSSILMEAVYGDPMIVSTHPEDNMLCKVYRPYLEAKYGFKWAPVELADKFSFELKNPAQKTFGFHNFFHKPFQEVIVIRRTGALGDVIALEPILFSFYKKGYKVVLDTLPQFFNLFLSHYFKIHHPDELDARVMANARSINLDMAYEITPKRLHLESYYEMSGIVGGEIRNPKLTLPFDPKIPEAKLFRKYCVLHIDKRPQEGRNVYGVDWKEVIRYLSSIGYTTIQIGHGEHEMVIGTTEMRNMNEPMLMRLIGGADLFLGIDSGPFNIALAMDTPSICFFGSVNPEYIIPDPKNVVVIQNHNPEKPICRNVHCWSSTIGQEGVECIEVNGRRQFKVQSMQGSECMEESDIPPCVQFTTKQVFDAIKKITHNDKN